MAAPPAFEPPASLPQPDFFASGLAHRLGHGVAVLAAAHGLGYVLLADSLDPGRLAVLIGACAALALLCLGLGAGLHAPPGRAGATGRLTTTSRVGLIAFGVLAVVLLHAVLLQTGVHARGFIWLPLLVCVVAVLSPRGAALGLTLVCALGVVALTLAEQAGALAVPPALAADRVRPFALLLALMAGALAGDAIAHAVRRAQATAQRREQRFAGLLSVAADWYWELDDAFRFTHVSEHDGKSGMDRAQWLGHAPWDIENFGLNPAALDAHRADLESHLPFAGLVLQRNHRGGLQWYSVSGRPRFDARGVFLGYWGAARNITQEQTAEVASRATEARYRELFARSPSPLVLHRHGQVIDANDAALTLFGMPDAVSLIGCRLLDFYDESDGSRQLAQERAHTLGAATVGESMPAHRFALRNQRGRRLVVQAASVMVDSNGGPAILSIYQDDTDRLRSEMARARSEALMTHLVATSPDLITLTELETGRYVMVNDAFARVSGWPREEAVGMTSIELGVWPDADSRERFVQDVNVQSGVRDRAMQFLDRHGKAFSLMVSAARFRLEGRDYMVLNGRDVTDAERARLEREAILQNASIGIALTRDRVFQLVNPKFEQLFGWEPDSLVGQPGSVCWPSMDDYSAVAKVLGPALARGEAVDIEHRMRRRDGSHFLGRLLARAVDPDHPSKGATIWIIDDVTERRAVDEALARARDDAEAASRAKSAFLANTSHEIRTPLNGLVGLARLARQPGLEAARRERYLQQIDESAQALSGVIGDILDLSKIEAGKLRLEQVDFDLHALLESIEHGYGALAEARGLTLNLSVHRAVPRRVRGDPARLRQILTNFLSNALKFTETGGVRIEVDIADADCLCFEVIDSGSGIDEAVQSRLFAPFTQADDSTTRRFGGTGLGLSICRELALLMNGHVGVESRPGQGSRFWARLPLPPSAEAAPMSAFGALPGAAGELSGMRVLIVEDNAVNMLIAVALLEQWDIEVTQAANGLQAIALVDQRAGLKRPFDLVLMDVQMPVMGGYDATRRLRQKYDAQALPIVALTAAALTSERNEALASGMNDFLTKPIDAQRLHDTLQAWRQRSGPAQA
ncbi:MAG: PAS domain S-box protein [Burkholderiaceae bacterium]